MAKEIFLEKDCLITSKTDLKGKIVYANDDFLAYAGYKMDEILYKPHNIVRHEDMPRTVFKFLWDYMKKGEEIFAYVKNKTKNNDYYWVFANVTPSFDVNNQIIGYYSVRRKPNPKALEQIKPLYQELLKFEQMSLDRGVEFLKDFCKNSHKSYNEFIFSLQEAK
ncbi:bipartate energy taxis response protein CetB [Campylobacter vulpis]|uniref:Histidine kinase n=1 Tax=Campylobacter vulpis TaxID=1655500 RepID=A0A2G4R4I3_9BACT|nr:PAS domain-containing protein [Campylobacter vulpis]MBS4235462.1 PAS domain-containing protein [Campylobacter vulpis]MBS4240461.1 PAS domain-containing protein [Campylobacter vulpis]MBS4251795.1 PAS domain-containing protein [Campylobacter vulpis]MBS4268968.1 PAS domain-containing protein [Campylobacter vulpis]MBS4275170.1 PAS domain-containing protein [Campylobacter vulpis]